MSTYQDYADSVSRILENKGAAEARAKEQGGQLWGSTIANLGQVIPQQVQQAMAQHAAKQKTAKIQSVIQQNGGDLEKSLPTIYGIDATIGSQIAEHVAKVNKDLAEYQDLNDKHQTAQLDLSNKVLGTVHDEDSYARWAILQQKLGRQVPNQYDPAFVKQERDSLLAQQQALEAGKPHFKSMGRGGIFNEVTGETTREPQPLTPPTDKLVPVPGPEGKPVYGTPQVGAPVYEKPAAAAGGSDFDQYLASVAKEKNKSVADLTSAEILAARKSFGDSGRQVIQISPTMQLEQNNAKAVAQGIAKGTTSPEVLLSSRATAQGMALQAELEKMGVDANKLTREWTATKRAIGALNSNSQVRLAEVINKASESLDKVEELNKQWSDNASRWGIKALNKAQLRLAQNGAYGPEAQSVAQRLDAQIADVTSELAQSIMGGNSPTDHAFELAKRNLSADWTQKTLTDSIQQARYNLNLAQNARNDLLQNLGVSSTQVQVPPPANAAPPAAKKVNPF